MKYVLTIADKRDQVIREYHGVELISHSKDWDMLKMRFDVDWEYSTNPEHPDYIMFSVFRDGTVNIYKYEWWTPIDDEIFGPGYNCHHAGTYKLVKKIEKEGE